MVLALGRPLLHNKSSVPEPGERRNLPKVPQEPSGCVGLTSTQGSVISLIISFLCLHPGFGVGGGTWGAWSVCVSSVPSVHSPASSSPHPGSVVPGTLGHSAEQALECCGRVVSLVGG